VSQTRHTLQTTNDKRRQLPANKARGDGDQQGIRFSRAAAGKSVDTRRTLRRSTGLAGYF